MSKFAQPQVVPDVMCYYYKIFINDVSHVQQYSKIRTITCTISYIRKQVDILISKNQVLQISYLRHYEIHQNYLK